jgi:hypothetical protein
VTVDCRLDFFGAGEVRLNGRPKAGTETAKIPFDWVVANEKTSFNI